MAKPDLETKIAAGRVTVTHNAGLNPDTGIEMLSSWECGAEQAEKHIATWTAPELTASKRLAAGDASAIRDVANEARKQRES